MKTFKDLKFEKPDHMGISRARMSFSNNYGVSVVCGPFVYSNNGTYEVAILKNNGLCYDTPITDDVLGWQTPEQITEVMKELQGYKENQY